MHAFCAGVSRLTHNSKGHFYSKKANRDKIKPIQTLKTVSDGCVSHAESVAHDTDQSQTYTPSV